MSNILFKDFSGGKDVELDASADAASYTAGTLTFANIDIMHPVSDGTVCSNVETLDKIFDDKSDEVHLKLMPQLLLKSSQNNRQEMG